VRGHNPGAEMATAETVRVIRMTKPGGPEVLEMSEAAIPPPPPGHVRVRVLASGVNRADLLQRMGAYPPPAGFPADIPGLEYAGVVESVGEGCGVREPGDRVMGIVAGGGYAEAINVRERETIRAPEHVGLEQAGAIPEAFITAWDALFRQARLTAGESVLIHAVGSGVGTAALQLAQALGARPVGTSRTPEKVERARELGLVLGVVGGNRWSRAVLELTGGHGADVILDLVGGGYVEGNLEVLARQARWIVVGVPGGSRAVIDFRRLMEKRASLVGTILRSRSPEEKVLLARAFQDHVVPLFERGEVTPVVDSILPAEEVQAAHRRLESNANFGKVLLRW
jgi:NADPH:quinone reductase